MRATLLPLKGKYCGSIIRVETLDDVSEIKVWHMGDRRPSKRQIRQWAEESDEPLDEVDIREMCSDNHFESCEGYEICRRIVAALTDPLPLNGGEDYTGPR
jgi:hypothetical protein